MKGLQDEILKSSASAFKFNKETGKFDASVEDTYRLKEQADLLGKSLDDVMQVGREAAKANFLKERFGFANLSEDELNLVSGLSEIDSSGKVTIDIPGFGKIEEADLASADAQKALNDYMEKAGDSEKDIAISNLNIAETQAKDINIIKTAVLTQMGLADRATLISDLIANNLPLFTKDDILEIYKVCVFSNDRIKDFFNQAKALWDVANDSISIEPIQNVKNIEPKQGLFYITDNGDNHLYEFIIKPIKKGVIETKCIIKKFLKWSSDNNSF